MFNFKYMSILYTIKFIQIKSLYFIVKADYTKDLGVYREV